MMTVALGSAVGLLSLSAAHAASIGGIASASLLAFSRPATVTLPTGLPCDDLSLGGAGSVDLDGRVTNGGGGCTPAVWNVHQSQWTLGPDGLRASKGASLATVETGTQDLAVEAVIIGLGSPNEAAGVVINHSAATGTHLLAVLDKRNEIQLRLVGGGPTTVLVSATRTITSPVTVRLERSGANVTVAMNGVVVLGHALNAAQQTRLGTGTGAGVFWQKGKDVRVVSIDFEEVP